MSDYRAIRVALAVVLIAVLSACGGGERRQVIQNKGSDTLVNVAQAWAEAYQAVDPAVVVAVSGGGSGTGIAALINGTVDIANASRAMKDKEIQLARDAGQDPVRHVVGFDALAVYLHAGNPATSMSIEQLAEIYGDGGGYTSWTDLGLEVPGCQNQEIVVILDRRVVTKRHGRHFLEREPKKVVICKVTQKPIPMFPAPAILC